jgi:hypothetical protein
MQDGNRKDSLKPLKRLWMSTVGFQGVSLLASDATDPRKAHQTGVQTLALSKGESYNSEYANREK